MSAKIILITGATGGIGKSTALALAKQGQTIIVHGRNAEKVTKVVSEIRAAAHNPHVTSVLADLSSLTAVQQMATEIQQRFSHLDVLINNAGAVMNNERRETTDGIETTMALNVMAPLLLTESLLPLLKKSHAARIINMSSGTQALAGNFSLNNLNFQQNESAQKKYAISKNIVIWNTEHLAKKLKNEGVTNVTVNVSHPGSVNTAFGANSDKGFFANLIYRVFMPLSATPAKGAETNIFLATSPKVTNISGKYFAHSKQIKPNRHSHTLARENAVWDYCQKIIQPFLTN